MYEYLLKNTKEEFFMLTISKKDVTGNLGPDNRPDRIL